MSYTIRLDKHLQRRQKCIYSTLLVLLWLMMSLASCGSNEQAASRSISTQPTPSPVAISTPAEPSVMPKDWPRRWLQGDPCRPPCWEGIMPGQTTAAEALKILQQSSLVVAAKMEPAPLSPEEGIVTWVWRYAEGGGEAYYHLQPSSQVIYAIRPYFPTSFRLDNIIEVYGEPSYVVARAYHGPDIGSGLHYALALVYLSKGFTLSTGGSGVPVLNADALFERVVFFCADRARSCGGSQIGRHISEGTHSLAGLERWKVLLPR